MSAFVSSRGRRPRRPGMRSCIAALACSTLLAALGGCGSSGARMPVRTDLQPYSPAEAELWNAARKAQYRFRIGDVFDVLFKYNEDIEQRDVLVLPDGRVSIPGFEDERILGKTVAQVDSMMTARYSQDYVAPDLTIIIKRLGASSVYVLGSVARPGMYDLPEFRGGVLQAIAAAGGFERAASSSEVLLIRATSEGFLYRHFDLSHLEKQGLGSAEALDLRPYDIIYVPRSPIGDLAAFTDSVIGSLLKFDQLFWDVYAVANLNKVDRLLR